MNELDIKYNEMGINAVVQAAKDEITALCTTNKKWRMSVPARWDDSDVLITQAIMMLVADNSKLREALEAVEWEQVNIGPGTSDGFCPACLNYRHAGHKEDCTTMLALSNAPLEDAPATKTLNWREPGAEITDDFFFLVRTNEGEGTPDWYWIATIDENSAWITPSGKDDEFFYIENHQEVTGFIPLPELLKPTEDATDAVVQKQNAVFDYLRFYLEDAKNYHNAPIGSEERNRYANHMAAKRPALRLALKAYDTAIAALQDTEGEGA